MVFRARLSVRVVVGSQEGKYMRADEPLVPPCVSLYLSIYLYVYVRTYARMHVHVCTRHANVGAHTCATRTRARALALAFVNPARDVHRFGGDCPCTWRERPLA